MRVYNLCDGGVIMNNLMDLTIKEYTHSSESIGAKLNASILFDAITSDFDSSWWTVCTYTQCDSDGWSDGVDFSHVMSNFKKSSSNTDARLPSMRRRR